MIFEHDFQMGVKDIGKNNFIKNRSILEMFENIGGYHSDLVGYGANDIERNQLVWILLGWKLQVIKRPRYGQTIHVKTWGRDATKAFTYRDFEMYDDKHELCAIATSKWTLVNLATGKLTRLKDEIMSKYELETNSTFENRELDKMEIPVTFTNKIEYTVTRRDIDINGHMHNLYYLDIAYEALPEAVYQARPYDHVQIQYKKEIKLGETVTCQYAFHNQKHVVCIFSQDKTILHAIITMF